MTVEQKRKRIQKALNTEFVDLDLTQAQRERLLWQSMHMEDSAHARHAHPRSHRTGGNSVRLKTKMSFSLALVLILFCLSVTALAVGLIINGYYERVAQMDASGQMTTWGLEEKISFVNVMREYEFSMNETDYATMIDTTMPDDERLAAADRIIYDRYGDLLKQEVATWMEQPDSITEIAPNEQLLFLERYMAEHPEGITTKEQYQQYTDALGYYLRDVYYPAFDAAYSQMPQSTPYPSGSREDAISSLRGRMTEVYGWDAETVNQLVPEVEWDEEYQMWTVSGEVSAESMKNCFEPVLEGQSITRTETGYRLTVLVDSKGNTTTNLDKEAFRAKHANDIEPQYKLTADEGNDLAFDAIMEKYGLSEAELLKLFCHSELIGVDKNDAAMYKYVYYPHYNSLEDPVFAAVVNLVTGEVTEVVSYQEEYRSPEWNLLFLAAEAEVDYGWYDLWPIEVKKEMLACMRVCGILPDHEIWQIADPDEAQIDSYVTQAFGAQSYPSAINTKRMMNSMFGADIDLWNDIDVILYTELMQQYHISASDALESLDVSQRELDENAAIALVRTAFCKAWQIPESALDTWQLEAQLVHDDHLDRGLIYYRVFLSCSDPDAAAFHGRRNFDYRVLVDGTIMDASMMSGWYSPSQEKAVLDEQQLYDPAAYQYFIHYAQQNDLLMEYGDFFHWSLAHKKACADQLRPILSERLASDEAFTDPRLIAFASHVYGIPDASMLTEQEATNAAWKLLQDTFGLADQEMSLMKAEIVLLDVTDEAFPFWQISFSAEEMWTSAQRIGLQPSIYYTIEINARTGEYLNSYTYGVDDGQTGVDAWNRWY